MKKINFQTKVFLASATIALLLGSIRMADARTVKFSGYDWIVKETASGTTMGPGANNWGSTVANDPNDIRVDNDEKLHLFVSQRPNGQWYSSEVYLPTSLGYGKYTFDIESRVDLLDKNLVAAPFLYQDDTHEIDIEHSLWNGETGTKNLFFTVQPYFKAGNQKTAQSTFVDGVFQDIIDWRPSKINFTTKQNGSEISSWTYTTSTDGTTDNFNPGNELVHINFWQYKGLIPTNATTSEFIIKSFNFEPYVSSTQTTTTVVTVSTTTSSTTTSSTTTTATTTMVVMATSTNITLATTSINLKIETSQNSLSYTNLLVTACPETDTSQTSTLNAMCALKQSGVPNNWSTFGTDMFLNSLNLYQNNQSDNGFYWNWFSDLNYGQTALNKHILTANENLLLTYDVLPLRISANSSTPAVGSTTTITMEQFGFDQFFNQIWSLATSSTLSINDIVVSNDSGKYYLYITSTNPIDLYGKKPGFVTSPSIFLYPTSTPSSASTSTTSTSSSSGGGSSSSSSSSSSTNQIISDQKINETVDKLIAFIKSKQDGDGKIVDGGTSDWVAMTFAAKGIYAADVKTGTSSLYDYVYNYDNSLLDAELNSCAAYPRHILALLASSVSKSDNKIALLKTKLDACVQNNKFGQNGINDDVFGLFAALALDENINSSTIQTTLNTILSDQQPDGSFTWNGYSGADITGAVINVLKYGKNKGLNIDEKIFDGAKKYLKNQQLADGGWGYGTSDALTTGWAVMGINALGETQTNWFNSAGKNPWYVLTTLDNDHFTQSWDGNIDWFGTKHAVPALLAKTWPIILDPKSVTNIGGGGGSSAVVLTTSPTSTTASTSTVATTTIATTTAATTTVVAATTTPIIAAIPEIKTEKVENKPTVVTNKPSAQSRTAQNSPTPTDNSANSSNNNDASSLKPQQELSAGEKSNEKNKLIENLPLDTPTRRTAKKVLAVTGGSAAALGLYLGLRLLKNVI